MESVSVRVLFLSDGTGGEGGGKKDGEHELDGSDELKEHRAESGKVAGVGNELRSADDEPSGNDEEQKQTDVNASENVRPFSAWGDGYFTSKNGTNEHRK